MVSKQQGGKKQGHRYSKTEEAVWILHFLNNNQPVFLHPAFCNQYFGPFFLFQTLKKFQGDLIN